MKEMPCTVTELDCSPPPTVIIIPMGEPQLDDISSSHHRINALTNPHSNASSLQAWT